MSGVDRQRRAQQGAAFKKFRFRLCLNLRQLPILLIISVDWCQGRRAKRILPLTLTTIVVALVTLVCVPTSVATAGSKLDEPGSWEESDMSDQWNGHFWSSVKRHSSAITERGALNTHRWRFIGARYPTETCCRRRGGTVSILALHPSISTQSLMECTCRTFEILHGVSVNAEIKRRFISVNISRLTLRTGRKGVKRLFTSRVVCRGWLHHKHHRFCRPWRDIWLW